jgi:putative transposase
MRKMAIEAIYRRPNTSKPAPGHRIYPYLLRGLAITRPKPGSPPRDSCAVGWKQVWAMDITYIPMARGFIYLAAVVDWFSRRVLAWKLSITMETNFCIEALEEALPRMKNRRFSTPTRAVSSGVPSDRSSSLGWSSPAKPLPGG